MISMDSTIARMKLRLSSFIISCFRALLSPPLSVPRPPTVGWRPVGRPVQRRHGTLDIFHQKKKGPTGGCRAADEHIVSSGPQSRGTVAPDRLPETPPDAIAQHRRAKLPRHREADPRRSVVIAPSRLDDDAFPRPRMCTPRLQEVLAALDSL